MNYLNQDNQIFAADGNDLIFAYGANDLVKTYGGNDTVNGGSGSDTIELGNGNDVVYAESGNDVLRGGDGNDTLGGGEGADIVDGGNGIDYVTYDNPLATVGINISLEDNIAGTSGDALGERLISIEILLGSKWNDTVHGSRRNDTINGLFGNDSIMAQAGDDIVYGWEGNDIFFGGAGNDTLSGEQHHDVLYGGDGNDHLHGDAPNVVSGNDSLYGEAGRDAIAGGDGDDLFDGGIDEDTLYGGAGRDLLRGGDGADLINGDFGDDTIEGGNGRDQSYGSDGNDSMKGGMDSDTLYGDYGNDILIGEHGEDSLFGSFGNDSVDGGDGNDILAGEDGNDSVSGSEGNDTIYTDGAILAYGTTYAGTDYANGGNGNDLIKTGKWNDTILGGAGDDWLFGEDDHDSISGGTGNDTINAGNGQDTVYGEDGNDIIMSYSGDDIIYGAQGNDKIYGLLGNDFLNGGIDQDLVMGDAGNDTLYGELGNDTLDGWDDNDTLDGGDGDDFIYGGDHADNLLGGAGHDLLIGERMSPASDPLPKTLPDILKKMHTYPGFDSWGLHYQGNNYTLDALKSAQHKMLVINPAKDALTYKPNSEILWNASEIRELKATGKKIYGYVNMAKIPITLKEWDQTWISGGSKPSWLGAAESNVVYKADFREQGWRDMVVNRIKTMIAQGFDGTLLDDVLEYYFQVTVPPTDSSFRAAVAERAVAMRDLVVAVRTFADYEVTQRDGYLNAGNRFKLVVNGAPYLPQDALNSEDINFIKGHATTKTYLNAIDLMLVENYVSQDLFYVDYVKHVYGNGRISFLSIDTDQITEQQRLQTITKAVHLGFMPYTTENTEYNTLNLPFFQELSQDSVNAGNDTLLGGDGNDTLDGGAGVDVLTGGAGVDVFRFSDAGHSKKLAHDSISDFEIGIDKIDVTNLQVNGIVKNGNAQGKLYVFTQNGDTYITNTQLNNFEFRIQGDKTAQLQATDFIFGGIVGTANNENLVGTGAAEAMRGLAGNDFLDGGLGNDTLFGGDGNDTLDGGQGADVLIGGNGADRFRFTNPTHSVFGTSDIIDDFEFGRDKIDVSNLIISNIEKSNTISTPNMLRITTWDGNTHVSSHQLGFEFRFKGDVTAKLSVSDFILGGIVGSNNADILNGTTGNDTIRGHGGNDTIYANSGNDTIDGGLGQDNLYGGSGADRFIWTALAHSTKAQADYVFDFVVGVDKLIFTGLGFTGIDTDGGATETGELRSSVIGGTATILSDQVDFAVKINSAITAFTASDFVF